MEARKREEIEFHDRLRTLTESDPEYKRLTSNYKWYCAYKVRGDYVNDWLAKRSRDRRVLDYCCGDGGYSLRLAETARKVVGIDIAPASVAKASRAARIAGFDGRIAFLVMDAENTAFKDGIFDVILCAGVLHHLDIERAYRELARLLSPGGNVMCIEPLAYNPVFTLYRKLTPHLRTKWEMEHILRRDDILLAQRYFRNVEIRFFGLTVLAAVPFRNTAIFRYLLHALGLLDRALLRVPVARWLAKSVVFMLSGPEKDALPQPSGGSGCVPEEVHPERTGLVQSSAANITTAVISGRRRNPGGANRGPTRVSSRG